MSPSSRPAKRHQRNDKLSISTKSLAANLPSKRVRLLTKQAGAGSFKWKSPTDDGLSARDIIRLGIAARTISLLEKAIRLSESKPKKINKKTGEPTPGHKIRNDDATRACALRRSPVYFDETSMDRIAKRKREDAELKRKSAKRFKALLSLSSSSSEVEAVVEQEKKTNHADDVDQENEEKEAVSSC